jgi:hypothetical protein
MPHIKEVHDRELPTELDAECKESQDKGCEGKGMNEQTLGESLADFNHAADVTE